MEVLTYSLLCYGITAAISLFVVAVILQINKFMSGKDEGRNE